MAAGSVAVAANPGPLLDQGPLLGWDLGHLLGLLDQGHLEVRTQTQHFGWENSQLSAHMGHFPQDRENEQNVSFFFKLHCDQTV